MRCTDVLIYVFAKKHPLSGDVLSRTLLRFIFVQEGPRRTLMMFETGTVTLTYARLGPGMQHKLNGSDNNTIVQVQTRSHCFPTVLGMVCSSTSEGGSGTPSSPPPLLQDRDATASARETHKLFLSLELCGPPLFKLHIPHKHTQKHPHKWRVIFPGARTR